MIAPVSSYDHDPRRLVTRLVQYWQAQCLGRAMPLESDIDPDDLAEDWDYCFLLQARDVANVVDYNFTYLGKRIIGAYNDASLDTPNAFMIGPNANLLSTHFHQVLDTAAPLIDEGEFQTVHGHRVLYRQCLLPLGSADMGVEAIFGGMNYKIVIED